jgi:hypothetical protein
VHPGAKIAKNVVIEFYNYSNNVGDGTWLVQNVTIMEGKNRKIVIYSQCYFSSSQDLKFGGEDS